MVKIEFSYWLQKELDKRNWKQADLARHGKINTATISRIISNSRGAGKKSLNAIADALKLPAELVFRQAGALDDKVKINQNIEEAMHLFPQMPEEYQRTIIDLMRVVAENKEKYSTK